MERGRLRQLPPELQCRMRSSVCVTSLGQLCDELVCNGIDAGAKKISIVVDAGSPLSVTVSDNGSGMSVGDVRVVSQRYHTSKMNTWSDLDSGVTTLGFRGEALSSISDLCILEVTSRATGSFETFTRISKGQSTLSCGPSRYQLPKAGTVVTCKDLFYNHPVRRGVIRRTLPKQLEDCRARLYRLALIHPEVGITLTDAGSRRQLLRAPPGRSLLSTLADAFGAPIASALMPVSLKLGQFRIRGYVTPPHVSLPSAELQFFYVNRRFVRRTPLHKAVNKAFASACASASPTPSAAVEGSCYGYSRGGGGGSGGGSAQGRRRGSHPRAGAALNLPPLGHPGYVLCLECPPGAYDVTYDVEKTLIEFRDWEPPVDLLREALEQSWPRRTPFDSRADLRTASQPHEETPRASPITPPLHSTLMPRASDPSPDPPLLGAAAEMPPPPPPPLSPPVHHRVDIAATTPPSPPRDFGIDVIMARDSADTETGEEQASGIERINNSPPRMTFLSRPDEDGERHVRERVDAEGSEYGGDDGDGDGDGDRDVNGGDRRRHRFTAEDDGEPEACVCCPPWKTSRARRGTRRGGSAAWHPPLDALTAAADDDADGGFLCQLIEPREDGPVPSSLPVHPPGARRERRGDVRELLATWKNPVFAPPGGSDQSYGAPAVRLALPVAVSQMSREVLDGARVVAQWGKKFVLAVSTAGDLFAVDQHAADERVRLEQLRGALLAPPQRRRPAGGQQAPPPSPVPTAVLGRPLRCQLTSSELATLRANASLAWRWGWRWEDNAAAEETARLVEGAAASAVLVDDEDADAGVSLTGVPTVEGTALGAEALAEYLREIAAIGATSAPPPAFHRLLASKACRGAIMFGDELSRGDCAALLSSLRRTQLPLHCAHGRPTAALLAPGVATASAPTAATAVDDDEGTPVKRRRMLVRRARKEWRVIQTLVQQASPEAAEETTE